ncbi:MAG: hypothetical protein LBP65_01450 [Puniceicoccales bacterium]|jgi:hypothetical protein|nr:hypothetical protein [Puniceicoccales bacterium]
MGTLERLQLGVYERLRSSGDLAGIEILNYRRGDLRSTVRVWLREACGLCAVVFPPLPLSFRRNCPSPVDATVELRVRVVEEMTVRGPAKRALAVAECIHRILSGARLPESQLSDILLPRSRDPWQIRENFPQNTQLEVELFFETQLFLEGME